MNVTVQELVRDMLDGNGFSPAQCRAARGLLHWSQQDLAERSKIGAMTLQRFEHGKMVPRYATLAAIAVTLYAAGIRSVAPPQAAGEGVILVREGTP